MDRELVYIGTYTEGESKGIYLFELDMATGALTPKGTTAVTGSPSFLALAPNHKYLYACNESASFHGTQDGAVSAFAIHKNGDLTFINQVSAKGSGPCHVSTDAKGKYLFTANYGSGSVAAFPIHADGSLGEATGFVQHVGSSVNKSRQEGPHAHSMVADPTGKYVLAADLGLDKILVYKLDANKGTLLPNDPPFARVAPGSGPRHIAFSRNGKYAYVINEMGMTIIAFAYDGAHGKLTEIQTVSTLPEGASGDDDSTAEVEMHPSGKFLYGSNRGRHTIAIFAVDEATGKLRYIGEQGTEGKTPRGFNIDPTGTFLITGNQDSGNVVVFRIDPQTGALTPTGQSVEVPKPVSVVFLPETH